MAVTEVKRVGDLDLGRECRFALIRSFYRGIIKQVQYMLVTNNSQWLRNEMWRRYKDEFNLEGEYSNPEQGVLIRWLQTDESNNIISTFDIVDLHEYLGNNLQGVKAVVFSEDVSDWRGFYVQE